MDAERFDTLVRGLLSGSSRRGVLAGLTSGLLACVSLQPESEVVEGKKRRKKKKKKKPSACKPDCAGKNCGDADGCSGFCTACPSGQTCQNGDCVGGGGCTPNCATKSCGESDGCGGRCDTSQGCAGWQCENFRCCVAGEGCNAGSQGAPCCGAYGQTCEVVGNNPDGEQIFGCQDCLGCCVTEDACDAALIGVGCCGTLNRCWTTNNVTFTCMPSGIG